MTTHNAARKLLITLALIVAFPELQLWLGSRRQACAPRVCLASAKPFLWSLLFGQRDGDRQQEPNDSYDKETLERAQWTTNDWIEKNNYTLELHNVSTADGYQLQLQRLPLPGCCPVLLVHGLFTSSLSWVLMGPGKSLAFLLRDKQYDVWLANLRGSFYGREHLRLNVSDAMFWNYSFHEQGDYDLPVIIDHVLDASSFPKLLLIGHSQAFNAFLVLCSLHPEYNERIQFMQALAPIAELRDAVKFDSADVRKVRKFIKSMQTAGKHEVFPAGYLQQKCIKSSAAERKQCAKLMETFAGNSPYSKNLEYILYAQLWRGGSLKELQHLTQIWKSGDFVAYDYDPPGNLQHYNSVEPYNYDLRLVTVPLVLHFGERDAIATPSGVHRIYARLIDSAIGVYRVPADRFGHWDFLFAANVRTLLNDKILQIFENFLKDKLPLVIE